MPVRHEPYFFRHFTNDKIACKMNSSRKQVNDLVAIVTFSHSGENLVGGQLQQVEVGLTQQVALQLSAQLQADCYQIQPVEPYDIKFNATLLRADSERHLGARPEVNLVPHGLEATHRVIYLGYPNWFGTAPAPVLSWLSQQSLEGVSIYPFCTHEGGGLGRSVADLQRVSPGAIVLPGLPIRSSRVKQAQRAIAGWLLNAERRLKPNQLGTDNGLSKY